jgi:hypothetical protein
MIAYASVICIGCANTTSAIDTTSNTSSIEDFNIIAKSKYKLGKDSIPWFYDSIKESSKRPYSLYHYERINISVKYLDKLIDNGETSLDITKALVIAIKSQIHINDTLRTANALSKITGISNRWDETFVNNYSTEMEPLRLKIISEWEMWIKSKEDQN